VYNAKAPCVHGVFWETASVMSFQADALGQSCTNADACAARIVEQNLIFVFFAPKPRNFHNRKITKHITKITDINSEQNQIGTKPEI
jgi:hypothetical protein